MHGQALLTAIVCAPWKLARAASGLCFRSSSTPRLLNDSAWVMSWCGDRQGGGGWRYANEQSAATQRAAAVHPHTSAGHTALSHHGDGDLECLVGEPVAAGGRAS